MEVSTLTYKTGLVEHNKQQNLLELCKDRNVFWHRHSFLQPNQLMKGQKRSVVVGHEAF